MPPKKLQVHCSLGLGDWISSLLRPSAPDEAEEFGAKGERAWRAVGDVVCRSRACILDVGFSRVALYPVLSAPFLS